MKSDRAALARALARPGGVRFFLLHGADEVASRELATCVGVALGADVERIDLRGADLKADPARLADEAAAVPMFGNARWVRVEQASDDVIPALEALVEAPAAGNPVVLRAGSLKATSKLLRFAQDARSGLAVASAAAGGEALRDWVVAEARALGLAVDESVAQRIADAGGSHRGLIRQELAKYALYADASPVQLRPFGHDALDDIGADAGEADLANLADRMAEGDLVGLDAELARLRAEGKDGITLLRAATTRMALIGRLRAEIERGTPLHRAIASGRVWGVDRDRLPAQVRQWPPALAARAVQRLIDAQLAMLVEKGPPAVVAEAELFTLCRQAARRR
ncbi:MAG: DNA polymerase III subunit delta [Sphingosinicella sp.]